ncbi:hypothetical protein [Bremerella alba]|uniref:Uncharacterized protein n=1 Tax=Bremerella alba TaxID=980252 RepID=A0A7V9A7X6_9BACT|nr:hypothetical protein [Bremerella alba]MBA2115461.1 hypothetical protein [Bremerella alba]
MSESSPDPEALFVESMRDDGVGLFINFVKQKDRFGHIIALVDGDECVPLFVSIEGDDEEPWPESPPFQEIHMEERKEGTVALLVGMAGDSHWSAAVEPMDEPGGIHFSVACRMKDYPMRICSRYGCALEETIDPTLQRDGPWVWKINEVEVCVDVIAQEQFPTPEVPASASGFEVNASLDGEPFPKTIQWRYKIWVR